MFCAQAGAAKVYAVEASRLAILTREVVAKNGFSHVIEVRLLFIALSYYCYRPDIRSLTLIFTFIINDILPTTTILYLKIS